MKRKLLAIVLSFILSILCLNTHVEAKTIKTMKNVTYKSYTKKGTCYRFTCRFNYETDNKYQLRSENRTFYRLMCGATIFFDDGSEINLYDKDALLLKDEGSVIVTFNNNGTKKNKKDDYIVSVVNEDDYIS